MMIYEELEQMRVGDIINLPAPNRRGPFKVVAIERQVADDGTRLPPGSLEDTLRVRCIPVDRNDPSSGSLFAVKGRPSSAIVRVLLPERWT